jgi:alpha-glucoside transport system permease protein
VSIAAASTKRIARAADGAALLSRRLSLSRLAVHLSLFLIVLLWTIPTAGLFISSLRDKQQLSVSGWWTAFTSAKTTELFRLPEAGAAVTGDGRYLIAGNILGPTDLGKRVARYGVSGDKLDAYPAGASADMPAGGTITVNADGSYRWVSDVPFNYSRPPRIFFVSETPPRFTLENYFEVVTSQGVGRAFVNTATVAIPATVIPILIAAFAAYALSWMRFPFRRFVAAAIVALLVVPLQMSLVPLLSLYNGIAHVFGAENGKTYLGVWLAHTAFGLPFAIFLLRNSFLGLPRDLFDAARADGASHFEVFTLIVLPLTVPAIASLAIFQFLWVWNDLLVAMVFLGTSEDRIVLTGKLVQLLGSRGTNWEILTAGAFVSIVVPLVVFFALQRYFVRGILTGSSR